MSTTRSSLEVGLGHELALRLRQRGQVVRRAGARAVRVRVVLDGHDGKRPSSFLPIAAAHGGGAASLPSAAFAFAFASKLLSHTPTPARKRLSDGCTHATAFGAESGRPPPPGPSRAACAAALNVRRPFSASKHSHVLAFLRPPFYRASAAEISESLSLGAAEESTSTKW